MTSKRSDRRTRSRHAGTTSRGRATAKTMVNAPAMILMAMTTRAEPSLPVPPLMCDDDDELE